MKDIYGTPLYNIFPNAGNTDANESYTAQTRQTDCASGQKNTRCHLLQECLLSRLGPLHDSCSHISLIYVYTAKLLDRESGLCLFQWDKFSATSILVYALDQEDYRGQRLQELLLLGTGLLRMVKGKFN